MFYLINDMIVAGSTYWNMVFGAHAWEAMEDEEGLETVRRFAENVAWLVNQLSETERRNESPADREIVREAEVAFQL